MQSVTYAECHLRRVSLMLSVTHNSLLLSAFMLNVVMLSVVAPFLQCIIVNCFELKKLKLINRLLKMVQGLLLYMTFSLMTRLFQWHSVLCSK